MTAEQLASAAGLVLSLVLGYVPGLKARYDALDNQYKVALTGGLLIVVAAGALAWGCRADANGVMACVSSGWEPAINTLIAALVANQAAYVFLVKPFKSEVPATPAA